MAHTSSQEGIGREAQYQEGSIVRARLVNIQTYRDVTIFPGPNLNLIVGPNGSGKSTIVCAIVLGLGGKPTLLGRHKNAYDYIQESKDEGSIELELFRASGKNTVLYRGLQRGSNDSKFKLNNKPALRKEIDELTSSLGINVGNLCQCLPQDKVSEFARMTPSQVLAATELAVGGKEMVGDHAELTNLGSDLRKVQDGLENREKSIDELEQKLNSLQKDYDRFQRQKNAIAHLKLMKQKKSWLEYEEAKQQHDNAKEAHNDMRRRYKQIEDDYEPQNAMLKDLEAQDTKFGDKIKNLQKCTTPVNSAIKKLVEESESERETISDCKNDIRNYNKLRMKSETKIAKLEAVLAEHEDVIAEATSGIGDDLEVKLASAKDRARSISKQISEIQHNKQKLMKDHKRMGENVKRDAEALKTIENVKHQREVKLKKLNPNAFKANEWLKSNRDKFKEKIFAPLLIELNVDNISDIKYVEDFLSKNEMLSTFYTLNTADQFELNQCFQKQKLNVIVQSMNDEQNKTRPCRVDRTNLKSKFKNVSFLDELVSGPEQILNYLHARKRMKDVVVFRSNKMEDIDSTTLREEFNVESCFFSNDYKCDMKKSSYGNKAVNVVTRPIFVKKLLGASVNEAEKKKLQTSLKTMKENMCEIENRIATLKDEEGGIQQNARKAEKEAEELKAKKDRLKKAMQSKKYSEEQIKAEKIKMDEQQREYPQLENKKRDAHLAFVQSIFRLKDNVLKMTNLESEIAMESVRRAQVQRQKAVAESQASEQRNELRRLKTQIKESKNSTTALKKVALDKLADAQKMTEEHCPPDVRLKDFVPTRNRNYCLKYDSIAATTVEAIDLLILQEEARLSCQSEADSNIVAEYEKIAKDLNESKKMYDNAVDTVRQQTEELETCKAKWLPKVHDLIAVVSAAFSDMFQHLGFAGDVKLRDNDENKFDEFGIEIYVCYRKTEKLRLLEASVQSGGEKSVATMLYLMSLQSITKCPFRIVDEINQGMDARNERNVYDQIVRCSEAAGTQQSQYFLITPKLLSNLTYKKSMKIISIFRGPWIDPEEFKTPESVSTESVSTVRGLLNAKRRRLDLS